MNKKILSLFIVSTLALSACGGEDTETTDNEEATDEVEEVSEDTADNETEEEEETEESDDDSEVHEFNQELIDDENMKATIVDIKKVYDEDWDEEKILVNFEIENKKEDLITAQARNVSINNKMVDESFLMMSQDIASGKAADATLTIESYTDDEIPELEDNLEMILYIYDENFDYENEIDVSVSFE